jgi:predicted transposase YbfD/YdcC
MKPVLITVFSSLKDPRVKRTQRHNFMEIVYIAIMAIIANADGWEDVEDFGEAHLSVLRQWFALPHGIPCADTFRRVFEALDSTEFQRCMTEWMSQLVQSLEGKLVAIDGKTARGSFARTEGRGPLHLVSAWVQENQLVLGQIATEDKSNEIVAIPKLLALLDLRGSTVTIDAMGCQKAIVEAIVNKKADYVIAVKENQPTLHRRTLEAFARAEDADWQHCRPSFDETDEESHGRVDIRRVWAMAVPGTIDPENLWKNLQTVVMVERVSCRGTRVSEERSYYITSHQPDAKRLGSLIRGHWSIENALHWTLDMTFAEDRSRIRSTSGARNFAALRKLGLAMLKRESTEAKRSVRRKRKLAAFDINYVLKVLSAENLGD